MTIDTIFFGPDDKIRSGWRFVIFSFGFFLLFVTVGSVTIALLSVGSVGPITETPGFFIVNSLVSLLVTLFMTWLCTRFLERLPLRSLGASLTHGWWRHWLVGLLFGVVTFAIAAGVGVIGGGLSFHTNAAASTGSIVTTMLVSFLVFAAAAAFEEALFRGYILQTFVRSDLKWFGVVLTSVIFASAHIDNRSADLLSWLNTFIAGIWFSVAYLKTRDLWLPFGLHLAWNWMQGSVFGIEVSGLTEIVKAPILCETDVGPVWLTGGDYGVEAGIAATVALIVSTAVLLAVSRTRAETPEDLNAGERMANRI